MRIAVCLILALAVGGCAAPWPAPPPAPLSSPAPDTARPDDLRKLGPDLRRHLVQQGLQALRQAQGETPERLYDQLRAVTVVIQARRDITTELEDLGVRVRSVTRDGVVVITADASPVAILNLITLPDVQAIELAQPVSPANADQGG